MKTHQLTVVPNGTVLRLPHGTPLTEIEHEFADELIAFGCRAGACGACLIEILEGCESLGPPQTKEREFLEDLGFGGDRHRLACQCRLVGDATVRAITI
jgi:ferredoxin